MSFLDKIEITEMINEATQYGYENVIFQTDKPKRSSEKNMPDYFMAGRGMVIFLELKLDDELSEGQKKLLNKIRQAKGNVVAGIITRVNYKFYRIALIEGNVNKLKTIAEESLKGVVL